MTISISYYVFFEERVGFFFYRDDDFERGFESDMNLYETACSMLNNTLLTDLKNRPRVNGKVPRDVDLSYISRELKKFNPDKYKTFVDLVLLEDEKIQSTTIQRLLSYYLTSHRYEKRFQFDIDFEFLDNATIFFGFSHFVNDTDFSKKLYAISSPVIQKNNDLWEEYMTLEDECTTSKGNKEDYKKRIKELETQLKKINESARREYLKYMAENNLNYSRKSSYRVYNIKNLFSLCVLTMIRNNVSLKKCANCGKYFYPAYRSDTLCCSNPAPQDSNKTCGEYYKYQKYLEKSNNDPATKLYKQIYNRKRNLCVAGNWKHKQRNEDFEKFRIESKQWKTEVKAGAKTEEEYIEWLKSVKERSNQRGNHNKTE